jgi:sugar/nucleoside kinase (ribokinase family)
MLKLNKKEFTQANKKYLTQDCTSGRLRNMLQANNLIVTKGAEGAVLYPSMYEAKPEVFDGSPDVTGCGDVFDVTFCYNYYIKKKSLKSSLKIAVDRATRFAYEPITERLICQN